MRVARRSARESLRKVPRQPRTRRSTPGRSHRGRSAARGCNARTSQRTRAAGFSGPRGCGQRCPAASRPRLRRDSPIRGAAGGNATCSRRVGGSGAASLNRRSGSGRGRRAESLRRGARSGRFAWALRVTQPAGAGIPRWSECPHRVLADTHSAPARRRDRGALSKLPLRTVRGGIVCRAWRRIPCLKCNCR